MPKSQHEVWTRLQGGWCHTHSMRETEKLIWSQMFWKIKYSNLLEKTYLAVPNHIRHRSGLSSFTFGWGLKTIIASTNPSPGRLHLLHPNPSHPQWSSSKRIMPVQAWLPWWEVSSLFQLNLAIAWLRLSQSCWINSSYLYEVSKLSSSNWEFIYYLFVHCLLPWISFLHMFPLFTQISRSLRTGSVSFPASCCTQCRDCC